MADSCTAVISCDEAAAGSISALINAGAAECAVTSAENGFRFAVKGTSAHAMCPEKGVNAINCLLTACKKAGILSKGSAETFFSAKVCTDTNGKALGIACSDELSGELTFNVGLIESGENKTSVSIDIRYPATLSSQPVLAGAASAAAAYDATAEVIGNNPPIYVPADQ